MAGKKITDLPVLASVTGDDLIALVDDPNGTAVTKVATVSAIASYVTNGAAIFRQAAKPTTRSDSSALVSGDRWLDTTELSWWIWNGSHWLSEQIYSAPTAMTDIIGTTGLGHFDVPQGYNLHLLRFAVAGFAGGAAYNGSNSWLISLDRRTASSEDSETSITLNAQAVSERFRVQTTLNRYVDAIALGITSYRLAAYKTNSPGNLSQPSFTTYYRLAKP